MRDVVSDGLYVGKGISTWVVWRVSNGVGTVISKDNTGMNRWEIGEKTIYLYKSLLTKITVKNYYEKVNSSDSDLHILRK